MMMKTIKALNLKGLSEIHQAAVASFAAKNRTCNRGGISPLQAVTASGKVHFRFNEALDYSEAIAKAERIRMGAIESYHWLDAHDALRRALALRSRPPSMEGIKEGTLVYVYELPAS